MRYALGILAAFTLISIFASETQARDKFNVSVGFGVSGSRHGSDYSSISFRYSSRDYCPPPVYRERVYYHPRPVYAPRPVVIVQPAPVYCPPPVVIHRPAPVYCPPPRVIHRAPVVVYPEPCRTEVIVSGHGYVAPRNHYYQRTTYRYGR